MFTSTIYSIDLSLLKEPSTFLTYMGFSIFFSLNLYFLANLELISNNASTVTFSCISILSNPVFIVTSLNMFLLSTTLLSIANLLLLESNRGLVGSSPHLNSLLYSDCSHILFSSLGLQFFIFYNSTQDS